MTTLLEVVIPGWIGQAVAYCAALGGGALLLRIYERRFPTNREKAETNKSRADFVKIYTDAEFLHFKLSDEVKKMVDAETKKFSAILMQREVDHRRATDMYLSRIKELEDHLEEANGKIRELERRVIELEGGKH